MKLFGEWKILFACVFLVQNDSPSDRCAFAARSQQTSRITMIFLKAKLTIASLYRTPIGPRPFLPADGWDFSMKVALNHRAPGAAPKGKKATAPPPAPPKAEGSEPHQEHAGYQQCPASTAAPASTVDPPANAASAAPPAKKQEELNWHELAEVFGNKESRTTDGLLRVPWCLSLMATSMHQPCQQCTAGLDRGRKRLKARALEKH